MKIKLEHFLQLRNAIIDRVGSSYVAIRKPYIDNRLGEERFRWDLLHATSVLVDIPLYDYLDDNHIDTALRSIVGELEQTIK